MQTDAVRHTSTTIPAPLQNPLQLLATTQEDVLITIFSLTNPLDWVSLSTTCKRFKQVLQSSKLRACVSQNLGVSIPDNLSSFPLLKQIALAILKENLIDYCQALNTNRSSQVDSLGGYLHQKFGRLKITSTPPNLDSDWKRIIITLSRKSFSGFKGKKRSWRVNPAISQSDHPEQDINILDDVRIVLPLDSCLVFDIPFYIPSRGDSFVKWMITKFESLTNTDQKERLSKTTTFSAKEEKPSESNLLVLFEALITQK